MTPFFLKKVISHSYYFDLFQIDFPLSARLKIVLSPAIRLEEACRAYSSSFPPIESLKRTFITYFPCPDSSFMKYTPSSSVPGFL